MESNNTEESLILYGECRTFDDAEFLIHFKIDEDDWRLLIPPFPLHSREANKKGAKVYHSGFGFYLHKFHTTYSDYEY